MAGIVIGGVERGLLDDGQVVVVEDGKNVTLRAVRVGLNKASGRFEIVAQPRSVVSGRFEIGKDRVFPLGESRVGL